MLFYLLSLITGILECGWIAYGAINALPLWQILCYPLAYQLGNLFPKPFSVSKRALYVMGAAGAICSSAVFFTTGIAENMFTYAALFLLSAVIQSVRSDLKCENNTLLKRCFRIGGFLISPIAAFLPGLILIGTSFLALAAVKDYKGCQCFTGIKSQGGLSKVMIFHQLHYFLYSHITLTAVACTLTYRYNKLGLVYSFVIFCATWITYTWTKAIVSSFTKKNLPVFFIGHILIIFALLKMMDFTYDSVPFYVIWVLTGFGGGVVYTIKETAKDRECFDNSSMTTAENIGHVLGTLFAVLAAFFIGFSSSKYMMIAASASAFIAICCMIVSTYRNRKVGSNENC